MTVNYRKIAATIADEIIPVEKRLIDALLELDENGLLPRYQARRRRTIISGILIGVPDKGGDDGLPKSSRPA